jgi:serine/threonine-protein kinase
LAEAETNFWYRSTVGWSELRIGDVVADRYRIEREIGRGGMGVVWSAVHTTLREAVAVKVVRSEAKGEGTRRFLREARIAARLTSEHAARVRDAGVLPSGAPFMVLELLVGRDLGALLRKDGPVPEATAARWVLEACDALAEAHSLGIVPSSSRWS